jgi:D-sedoheptulose 7-phosphate isomerase
MDFTKQIEEYYQREKQIIDALDKKEINEALNAILRHYENEDIIYVLGNGGSSATANHMVCDFDKGISLDLKKQFRVISLSDNIPMIMAIGNDIGFEDVFYLQLKNKLKPTDLVIAISGSGNSHNIVKAVQYANEVGAEVIGLTGYAGGKLKNMANINVHVPVEDMQITEDMHMSFVHVAMQIFWRYLMAKEGKEAVYKINQ